MMRSIHTVILQKSVKGIEDAGIADDNRRFQHIAIFHFYTYGLTMMNNNFIHAGIYSHPAAVLFDNV